MKQILNIMAEIEDSMLNRYLIVISTFWHRLSNVILLSPLLFNVNVMVYSTAVSYVLSFRFHWTVICYSAKSNLSFNRRDKLRRTAKGKQIYIKLEMLHFKLLTCTLMSCMVKLKIC